VADNYNSRIFKAMKANNEVFGEALDDLVRALLPGLQPGAAGWEWCVRENSTYLDCPTAEYSATANIMVGVFNPATNGPTDYLQVPVRHGNYDVSVYSSSLKQWT
jgi:hypothetical protein